MEFSTPPPMKKRKSTSISYKCICNWGKDCEFIFNKFHENLEDNHVWKKNHYQFRAPDSIGAKAFQEVVFDVFDQPEEKKNKVWRLAYHHFPQLMLTRDKGRLTSLLTKEQVVALDMDLRVHESGYHTKKTNVELIWKATNFPPLSTEDLNDYGHKYVKAPLTPKDHVLKIAQSFQSQRKVRTSLQENIVSLNEGSKLSKREKEELVKSSADVYKTVSNIHQGLISKWKNLSSSDFHLSEFVLRAANDASFMARRTADYPTAFELAPGHVMYLCMSSTRAPDCQLFKVLKYQVQQDIKICEPCFSMQRAQEKRDKRHREDAGDRISPSSRVNITYLSPSSLQKRRIGLSHQRKAAKVQVKNLKLKLESPREEEMVAINSDEAKSVLHAAFDHVTNKVEKAELKEDVIKILLTSEGKNKMDTDEVEIFASRVCKMLQAESKKLSGDDKQVRYDFRMKRLALAHFLEFGKSGYNQLRETSLEILPCVRTNERELVHLRGGEESNAAVFAAQFADALKGENQTQHEVIVQIIFDELKVKCGVAYNPKTGKEYGFTASKSGRSMSFADEILSIAETSLTAESEEEDLVEVGKEPYVGASTYANVFKLRTARNKTWTLAYYFNTGSLDGDDVIKQLLDVLAATEIVGMKVYGQVSDAGGGNIGAITLLTKNKCNGLKDGKPEKEDLQYVNPLNPYRSISTCLCSVHSLKNNRNVLCNRDLVNAGKVITWKVIIRLYHHLRENFEGSVNVHELRRMKRSVAYPDQFTKQNVNDAKQVFEEATIAYQCRWLADKMGFSEDFFDALNKEFRERDGYSDELLERKLKLLKDEITLLPQDEKRRDGENELAFLEFTVTIHVVFMSRLLNSNARLVITPELRKRDSVNRKVILSLNVNDEIHQMEARMKYFDDWRAWSKGQSSNLQQWNKNKWADLCISSITLRNIKISVFAFLYYAKDILENQSSGLSFVPYLHSNSSTLESSFSSLRASGRDTSLLLEKGIIASNVRASTKLMTSKSYSTEHSTSENENFYTDSYDITAGPKERDAWLQSLVTQRAASQGPSTTNVSMFPTTMEKDHAIKIWLQFVGEEEDFETYSEAVLKYKSFMDYGKASTHSPEAKKWFENVILGNDKKKFDSLCQRINERLLKFLITTAKERKEKKHFASFHIKIFNMLQDVKMNGIIGITSNISTEERMGIVCLVLVLTKEMEKKLHGGLIKYAEEKAKSKGGEGKELHVRDVNLIVGWAIFHLRLKKIVHLRREDNEDSVKGLKLKNEISFLSHMRMYAEEALLSQSYLDKCYDSFLRSSNRGFMTLVSEEYFAFGVEAMKKVSSALTGEKLQNQLQTTQKEKQRILNDKSLLDLFMDCSANNNHLDGEEEKKIIFYELMEKIVNARFGEEIRAHKEEFTTRGSKNKKTNLTLRKTLDVIGSKKRLGKSGESKEA